MNKNQKIVSLSTVVLIVFFLLYPPFRFYSRDGVIINMGYSFILDPPKVHGDPFCVVDTTMLLLQWVAVVIVGFILWLYFRENE